MEKKVKNCLNYLVIIYKYKLLSGLSKSYCLVVALKKSK